MDEMTDKEKAVVEELRNRTIMDVTPKMLEDVSLFYRFAKARDFNRAEAETMLRNHISYRKELKIDTILTDYEPPEVLVKYASTSLICFDKDGCIVRLQDCGRADANGLWSVATKTEWAKFCAYIIAQDIETIIKREGNLGKPIYAAIDDFDKLTYANAISLKNIQYLLYLLKLFIDNYPELVKTITIINAPSYFVWVHKALKQVFPENLIRKIRIYGTDGWKEVFLNEISAEDLPSYLGGNRTDPDGNPLCETIVKRGKPIPKSLYIQNRSKKLSMESDVKKITVMPLSKEEITLEVKEEHSILEWEFQSISRDIDFSLVFRRESSKGIVTEELIPKQRIDTRNEPQKGRFQCENTGKYVIVFDNSNSWIYLKEIYYRVKITNNKDFNITDSFSALM